MDDLHLVDKPKSPLTCHFFYTTASIVRLGATLCPMANNDIATLMRALAFAAHKHRDQRRKDADASPYVNHPIAVANILTNEGGITDITVLCAAVLHDTVEDTQTTHAELVEHFGEAIADVVAEVTDDKSLPKAERKRLQIEHARHASHAARLVKLADKISNLRDLHSTPPADWSAERRAAYVEWSSQVIDAVRGTHAGLEALFDVEYAAPA